MKIEYEEINGLLYPKLALPPQKEVNLTRFGRKRLQYLKQYQANTLYDRLIEQYKIKRNITEELKEKDQMRWVQEMNNIQNCVEEVINYQIIYV